jgi:LmbE family N-acetylglucosaminyl deacetylase
MEAHTEHIKNQKKIIIKTKEHQEIELKTNSSVNDFFLSLLQSKLPTDETHSSNYIMKFDRETMEIKFVQKDELINGKSDLEDLTHPFFSEMKKSQKVNQNQKKLEILPLEKNENILLFSPHPDDEILGACGLLYKCFQDKINIKVVYMTSGKTAGGAETRQIEAINGIKKLGGSEENLFFTTFPFYDRKDRIIQDDDYEYARDLLRQNKPSKVFICADIFDPNRTHKKCFEILTKIMTEDEFKNIKAYFYYSVWYWPEEDEYTHILPYDYETYKMKIYAMLEHRSQIETKFMGNDPRPFYQRATARDQSFGKTFNYDYCEVYFQLKN